MQSPVQIQFNLKSKCSVHHFSSISKSFQHHLPVDRFYPQIRVAISSVSIIKNPGFQENDQSQKRLTRYSTPTSDILASLTQCQELDSIGGANLRPMITVKTVSTKFQPLWLDRTMGKLERIRLVSTKKFCLLLYIYFIDRTHYSWFILIW